MSSEPTNNFRLTLTGVTETFMDSEDQDQTAEY